MKPALKKALDPYIRLAPFFGIGLVVAAVLLGAAMFWQRSSQLEMSGSILKVRTLALDDRSAAVILDLRVANPSHYTVVVRRADIALVDLSGNTLEGEAISEMDVRRLFEYFPILGQKYNDSLVVRTKIGPGLSLDCMLAARFEVSEQQLKARQRLRIHIEDLDGPSLDLVEQPR